MTITRKWNGKSTYRLELALRAASSNRAALATVQVALQAAERQAEREAAEHLVTMMELDIPADELVLGHSWECEGSPTGLCIYHDKADPGHDHCLVCDEPSERK